MPFARLNDSMDVDRENGSSNRQQGRPDRVHRARQNIQGMFSGRSVVGPRQHSPEARKTPRINLGLQHLPSPRINLPRFGRSRSNVSRHTLRNLHEPLTPISARPITPSAYRQLQLHAEIAAPQPAHRGNRQLIHREPMEGLHTVPAAPQQRRKSSTDGKSRFCFPKVTDPKMRKQIWACALSGMFLATVLSTYLALALTSDESQEFHVILILVILVATIYFCHSLITLCVIAVRPRYNQHRPSMSAIAAAGGYANPDQPIRVALARDEEAAGIESLATKLPPPAYGLWRESVRVDPDRIFWQRNQAADLARQNDEAEDRSESRTAINRPPSYISDDGVDYVIEAAPRSIAPTVDVPLPPHPSEIGRGHWGRGENGV